MTLCWPKDLLHFSLKYFSKVLLHSHSLHSYSDATYVFSENFALIKKKMKISAKKVYKSHLPHVFGSTTQALQLTLLFLVWHVLIISRVMRLRAVETSRVRLVYRLPDDIGLYLHSLLDDRCKASWDVAVCGSCRMNRKGKSLAIL